MTVFSFLVLISDATRCKNLHPPLSKAQGEVLLKKDVSGFEKYICQTVTHQLKCPLNCNQFGALVSFAYNTGTSANGFRLSKVYEQLKAGCNYKVRKRKKGDDDAVLTETVLGCSKCVDEFVYHARTTHQPP